LAARESLTTSSRVTAVSARNAGGSLGQRHKLHSALHLSQQQEIGRIRAQVLAKLLG